MCLGVRFNLIGLLAATLGDDQLAAFNASYKVIYIVHQFGMSLGIATNIRVGNLLGSGEHYRATRTSWIGVGISSGIAFVLAIVVYAFPGYAARIFSSDPNIIHIFTTVAPYLVSAALLRLLRFCGFSLQLICCTPACRR